jgi:RNA polymerase sigma-B factor
MRDSGRTPLSTLTNEELIERLREGAESGGRNTADLREEIVRRNVGLVKSVALKFLSSGEPLDDLIQAGYIGLLNAVTNFDLARNIRFSTYASYLIQGEIRHYIRDKHSTIRIPQWVQTMNRRVKEVEEAIFQQEGRPPTLSELAARLDLTETQVTTLLRGRETMTYVSIDQERRTTDPNPAPPTVERLMSKAEDLPFDVRIRVLVAIEQLNEIQQQIIGGLFYEGKSQSEVGKELGMSQRQVSRLKDRILDEMKENLEHGPDN